MKVVFVVGTTASGKSDVALDWARRFQGVIVNCDSVQIYKDLDIGSAKPSLQERSLCPHFLYDYVSAPDVMTAGIYHDHFFQALNEIKSKHGDETPVFVVGGTGFYFQAIEKGMHQTPEVPVAVRQAVEAEMEMPDGAQKLYEELLQLDAEAAAKIKPQDRYRISRAVELLRTIKASAETSQLNLTSLRQDFEKNKKPFPFPLMKVGPSWNRDVLRQRIEVRVQKMLKAGLIEEVQQLVDRGLMGWAPLQSVGYVETLDFLEHNRTKEWLLEQIVIHTHQLAKRQRTWFQRDAEIHWFEGAQGPGPVGKLIEEFLRK